MDSPAPDPAALRSDQDAAQLDEKPTADSRGEVLERLSTGRQHHFSDWPIADIPASAGVYTVWDGTVLVYVGTGGRNGLSG